MGCVSDGLIYLAKDQKIFNRKGNGATGRIWERTLRLQGGKLSELSKSHFIDLSLLDHILAYGRKIPKKTSSWKCVANDFNCRFLKRYQSPLDFILDQIHMNHQPQLSKIYSYFI